MPLTTVEI